MSDLVSLSVARFSGDEHFNPVQLFRQFNLAGEAAELLHTGGKVEHVLFLFTCGLQFGEPFFSEDDMAGGARHLPFAGSLQRHSSGLPDFQQPITRLGFGFDFTIIAGNEEDFNGTYPCCAAASLIIFAACSSSVITV